MSIQRRKITEVLDGVLARAHFGEDVVPLEVTDSQADAVIAHMWERADDPEVVEAALDAAEAANHLYPLDGEPYSVWQVRYFSAAFGVLLEQLIGPRPTEQESANER